MKKTIIIAGAAAVIVGVSSFAGGMVYAKSKVPAGGANAAFSGAAGQRFGGMAQNGQAGAGARGGQMRANGGIVNGDILSVDDKSVTIKMRDGGSKIVFFSASTEVGKFVTGTSADLTVGETVMVTGTANSDGSVTAKNIQIRPAGEQFGGPGGRPVNQQPGTPVPTAP